MERGKSSGVLSKVFGGGSRFVKQVKRFALICAQTCCGLSPFFSGAYFAVLFYSEDGKVLTNALGGLPMVSIDESFSVGDFPANFAWAQKVRQFQLFCVFGDSCFFQACLDWDNLLQLSSKISLEVTSLQFRKNLADAVEDLQVR